MSNKIYLDYAATSPVLPEVMAVMKPFWEREFGNPSSLHSWGEEARMKLDQVREEIGELVEAERVIFTGSATEAINLSHKGLVESLGEEEVEIVTTAIEHKAVLETCDHLERQGKVRVRKVKPNREGVVRVEAVLREIGEKTRLVSLMWVNNEVGTEQPVKELGIALKKLNQERKERGWGRVYFHSDVTQGIGLGDFSMKNLELDMASMTGHKIGAAKGVGALFLKEEIKLARQIDGGDQEGGTRAGTENMAYIVGLAEALKVRVLRREENRVKIYSSMDYLVDKFRDIQGVGINGPRGKRMSHIVNIQVAGVEGEALVMLLSDKGVGVSTGSACTTGDLRPSHVLTAMGVGAREAHGSLRWSLNETVSKAQIDQAMKSLKLAVAQLRGMRRGINV